MQPFGEVHEPGVAGATSRARGVGIERGPHAIDIRIQVERRAVVEEAPPLGVEGHEVKMILQFATRFGVDPLEHAGDRQDRRSHVESEALLGEHGRLAADPWILVAECHGVAAGRERAGRRQAAEAATHDHHSIVFTRRVHRAVLDCLGRCVRCRISEGAAAVPQSY